MKRSLAVMEENVDIPVPTPSSLVENATVLPNHHYHLGGLNYVAVTFFSGSVLIHIREYLHGENGNLIPTRKGTTLTPSLWLSIVKKCETYKESALAGEVVVVNDSLLISRENLDIGTHVTFQRYYKKKDFTRQFCYSACLLSEIQFVKLMCDRDLQRKISSSVTGELYSHVFPQTVLREVKKYSVDSPPPQIEQSDVDMLLTTSLIELLKTCIEENVPSAFQCTGCEENYENQLGHECLTFNYEQKIWRCGEIAILDINMEQLSQNFVEMNKHIVNYINDDFFSKLDATMLMRSAKDLFIASDPLPLRMF